MRDAAVPLCLIENCVCACVCLCERKRDCVPLNNVSHFQMGLASFSSNKNQTKRLKIQRVYFSYPFYLLHSESFQTHTFTIEFFDESKLTVSVKQQFKFSPFLPFLPLNL